MKKITALLLVFLMLLGVLVGCSEAGKNNETTVTTLSKQPSADSGKREGKPLKIVTTIFPEYDWVREILGSKADMAELTMLLDNGVDLHSYQPTAEDLVKISDCDLFVYVGGESDGWVENALKNAANKDRRVINLLDVLKDRVKTEEAVPGMQAEKGHSHGVADFADSDVQDRSLSDWNGQWQSVYPYVLDGTLDPVMEMKAESGKMTAEEYKNFYRSAYETDVEKITIDGNTVTYTRKDGAASGVYDSKGFYIRHKDNGSKQVRYKYQKVSGDAGAPTYLVFSDHNIASAEPEHFHLYFGDAGFDGLVEEGKRFPTFYPADLTGEQIVEEILEHGAKEYDEHVWLSLKNAAVLVNAISESLQALDPDNKDTYAANAAAYGKKLSVLDAGYQKAVDAASNQTVLFGDRFPFRYLVDDYGLSYYAAFAGCSAESEASFETISFLAKKMDELKLPCVLTIEGTNHKIAETVVANTAEKNQKVLTMDSMQSTTSRDGANGTTYLAVMEKNLAVLAEALG